MTQEQINEAKIERDKGAKLSHLAIRYRTSIDKIKRAIIPNYAEHRAAQVRAYRNKHGQPIHHRVVRPADEERRDPVYDPRRDGWPQYRSPSYELMGDPPIGRSALDMRGREC